MFGECLIYCLEKKLQDEFTPDVKEAWMNLINYMNPHVLAGWTMTMDQFQENGWRFHIEYLNVYFYICCYPWHWHFVYFISVESVKTGGVVITLPGLLWIRLYLCTASIIRHVFAFKMFYSQAVLKCNLMILLRCSFFSEFKIKVESRTEEPAKVSICSHDRRALQQLSLNVQIRHFDLDLA